jgi:hypothetical protein
LKTEKNGIDPENPFLAFFHKHENMDVFSWEILIKLVEHNQDLRRRNVAVRFKHTDDMCHVWEFIEVNTNFC